MTPIKPFNRFRSRMTQREAILYFNGSFVHRKNGAHARVTSLIELLVDLGIPATVYSYENHPDSPWTSVERARFSAMFPGLTLVTDRIGPILRCWIRAKKLLIGLAPGLARRLLGFRMPFLTPNYARLCADRPDAVLILNYANGIPELNGVSHEDRVIETHDLDFIQFSKRFGHEIASLRIMHKLRAEIVSLQMASHLIAITQSEEALFRTLVPEPEVYLIPDYGSASQAPTPASSEDVLYDLVFVGSDNYFNREGLVAFLSANRDWLAPLRIAIAGEIGNVPEVRDLARASPNIAIFGYVADLRRLYSQARAAISPIDGTGLKIKAVEAIAAGLPVFSSPHTIEGLPAGSEKCVFPISKDAILGFLGDPGKQSEASAAALDYIGRIKANDGLTAFRAELGRLCKGGAPTRD